MYYLVALPIAVLLYHSIWNLGKKYMGHEPFWLKIYAFAALIYIIVTPISFVYFISERLGFSNSTSAYLAIFIGITVLVSTIKFYPKQVIQKDGVKEWE